jgi:hypothetical protein
MGPTPRPRDEVREAQKMLLKQHEDRKKVQHVNQLVVAPERHISVDTNELRLALKNRLELDQREAFDDLCKLMEGVANFDFFDLKRRIRQSFLPFAAGAKNQVYLQRTSKSLPSTISLDDKELIFIRDVYEVLRASHYRLLTRQEWEIATSEDFIVSLPVEVNWDYMDKDMLPKFWNSSPELKAKRATLPDEMADRILVFHRGVGTQKLSGLLIDQKLDLLMNYTIWHVWDMIKDKLVKKKDTAAAEAGAAGGAGAAKRVSDSSSSSDEGGAGPSQPQLGRSRTIPAKVSGGQLIQSHHKFAKVGVDRREQMGT